MGTQRKVWVPNQDEEFEKEIEVFIPELDRNVLFKYNINPKRGGDKLDTFVALMQPEGVPIVFLIIRRVSEPYLPRIYYSVEVKSTSFSPY